MIDPAMQAFWHVKAIWGDDQASRFLRLVNRDSVTIKWICSRGVEYEHGISLDKLLILGSGAIKSRKAMKVFLFATRSYKTTHICNISACINPFHVVLEHQNEWELRKGCADGTDCECDNIPCLSTMTEKVVNQISWKL